MPTQSTYQSITNSSAGKGIGTVDSEIGVFVIGEDEFGGGYGYAAGSTFTGIDNASQGYQSVGNNSQTYWRIDG